MLAFGTVNNSATTNSTQSTLELTRSNHMGHFISFGSPVISILSLSLLYMRVDFFIAIIFYFFIFFKHVDCKFKHSSIFHLFSTSFSNIYLGLFRKTSFCATFFKKVSDEAILNLLQEKGQWSNYIFLHSVPVVSPFIGRSYLAACKWKRTSSMVLHFLRCHTAVSALS